MHYDAIANNHGLPADPFKACVGPRPIGWISSVSLDGVDNLAPFSQFNNLSFDPPMVMLSLQYHGDDYLTGRKDTLNNIESTGGFVYNIVPYALKDQMNITAVGHSPEVDEFELAGLTKAESIEVAAKRVAESPIQFECEYMQTIHFPSNNVRGVTDVIIARVLVVHIDDNYITPEGRVDFLKIQPLGRMGYLDYTVVNEVLTMPVPGLTAEKMASMIGERAGRKE